jgi:divalent metal cation (Fe/Co/Zn/Cd) transporter
VLTGIEVLDACVAALVALHVLWNGYGILRENARGLMDQAAPAEELERIRAAISGNITDAIEAHALRTRHSGKATFIDVDLVVSGNMSVSRAHEICDRLRGGYQKGDGGGHCHHPRRAGT